MNKALVLSGAVTFAFFAFYGLPKAIDHQLATSPAQADSSQLVDGHDVRWWARHSRRIGRYGRQEHKNSVARGRTIKRLKRHLASRAISPSLAIRVVFGQYADAALRVSWCESRWYTGARNGQFFGLFQMGRYARSTYGHGSTALEQARAAYRYFAASGFDWSPWACRP